MRRIYKNVTYANVTLWNKRIKIDFDPNYHLKMWDNNNDDIKPMRKAFMIYIQINLIKSKRSPINYWIIDSITAAVAIIAIQHHGAIVGKHL